MSYEQAVLLDSVIARSDVMNPMVIHAKVAWAYEEFVKDRKEWRRRFRRIGPPPLQTIDEYCNKPEGAFRAFIKEMERNNSWPL